MRITCNHCGAPAELVTGKDVYGRADLEHKRFWHCAPCDAFVGCHPRAQANGKGGQGDGTVPLGTLATREERWARNRAHAAFDSMWQPGGPMRRQEAYAWLAAQLGIAPDACHIGMFGEEQCERVRSVVAAYFTKLRSGSKVHRVPAGTIKPRQLSARANP